MWKYNINKAQGATVAMTVQGLENAKISSTTIHLLGYTVKNRVIVDKKYFLPLNPVTPISPTAGDFTVIAPDYPDVTKVKLSKTINNCLFTIKINILSYFVVPHFFLLSDSSSTIHSLLILIEATYRT